MNTRKLALWGVFALLLTIGLPVWAAETGNVAATVVDADGKPLPGVTATITGPNLIGPRATTTDINGSLRFPLLPVGTYDIKYELQGFATLTQEGVMVRLGMTTPTEVAMKSAEMEVMVTVTAEQPLIETETADSSVRLSGDQIDYLPTGDRSFRDMAKYVPGVTGVRVNTVDGTNSDGMPSIRGEGQYGNNYMIDGLSVRDPATKSTSTPLNFDAIEEIQVITDPFSPEFGRMLGGAMNVVTKSGGNEFHGEVAILYESDALASDENTNDLWSTTREYTEMKPYINLGGPIMKDRLWYFFSYNRFDTTDTFQSSNAGLSPGTAPVGPDNLPVSGLVTGGDEDTETDSLFGKLTFAITPDHTLALSGTYRDGSTDNIGMSDLRASDARGMQENTEERLRINLKSIWTPVFLTELKIGTTTRELTDLPASGDASAAQHRELNSGYRFNNYDSFDESTRDRTDFAFDLTYFLDEAFGTHEIKTGLSYELGESSRNLKFTGWGEDIFPDSMYGGSEMLWTDSTPYLYYDYSGAGVENKISGLGFYVQDKWSPVSKLNLMLGFRLDNQSVENDRGDELIKFKMGDTFAPRVAATYDITGAGTDVIKIGVGRFYDLVSTSLAEWGNTSNPYSFDRYEWGGPANPNWEEAHDPNNWGAWYDEDGDGEDEFHPGEAAYTQDPSGDPLIYDTNLKPFYKDEILVQYDHAFGEKYAATARYVWSQTRDLIEDVAFTIDDWVITNFDRKKRDYRSAELEFRGRPTENAEFSLAYVNSKAEGSTPGQFERGGFQSSWGSGNNVGVFGDRPPFDANGDGIVDEDELFWAELLGGLGGLDGDDGWYGELPYSVDHQITLRGTYRAPYDIIVGAGFEWNSGYHWQKRGFQEAYGGYLTFPEGRGARELPSIYYLDVSVAKLFKVAESQKVGVRLDVFNITDNDTPVSYVQEDTTNFGAVLKRQDPRSARITINYIW